MTAPAFPPPAGAVQVSDVHDIEIKTFSVSGWTLSTAQTATGPSSARTTPTTDLAAAFDAAADLAEQWGAGQ